jgi:hypothetical protein
MPFIQLSIEIFDATCRCLVNYYRRCERYLLTPTEGCDECCAQRCVLWCTMWSFQCLGGSTLRFEISKRRTKFSLYVACLTRWSRPFFVHAYNVRQIAGSLVHKIVLHRICNRLGNTIEASRFVHIQGNVFPWLSSKQTFKNETSRSLLVSPRVAWVINRHWREFILVHLELDKNWNQATQLWYCL